MSRLQSNRRGEGPGAAAWVGIGALCVVGLVGAIALGAWRIGVSTSGGQAQGWTTTATVILIVGTLVVLALGALVAWAVAKGGKNRTRVDAAARYLGNRYPSDLAPFTREAAAAQAERLHATAAGPGVPLGEPVSPR